MRKVPGKLQRERGQNLKPFLLNVLANILAPSSFYAESPTMAREATSDQSLKSFDSSEISPSHQISSKIALDNLLLTQKRAHESAQGIFAQQQSEPRPEWTRETSKVFTFFILQIGNGISDFFIATFILFQKFFDRIFEAIFKKQVQKMLDKILQEETILYLIQSFQNMLLTQSNNATDEEKKLRAELTQRRLDQFLEDSIPNLIKEIIGAKNFRQIASDIVQALQLPRLNKQLSFVLLDALIQKIQDNPNL
uniref:Sorting nexin C-terminal domain-containing protein n=1 Tax=Panagrolaimus superbus TaxID=310955 RepID=A0A914YRR5_9BILA